MIIKADNRGRLALGKLNGENLAHTEWDVNYSTGTFTVKPADEEPKSEWVGHRELSPEMIGRTVIITGVQPVEENLMKLRLAKQPASIVGILEAFSSVDGDEWASLKGMSEKIDITQENSFGSAYGTTTRFYVQE